MSRKDQYRVTVSVDGLDLGVFDTFEGGEVDSEEKKYKPGGMAPEVSLGGSKSVSNITVGRLYVLERDHALLPTLFAKVGKGTVTANKQPLDVDGNVFGKPLVYTGKLKTVTPPDADSNSGDEAILALEISSAGTVA